MELLHFPKILDQRGNLSFLQSNKEVPFEIKRVYWIYDVPGGEMRGGHAYKNLNEVIIALSGSYDVVLHDGEKEYRYHLNRSYYGLYVPKMMWRHIENFSTNSLALILTDDLYKEDEYIRDFDAFKAMKGI
ncbi:WxcM-like domain-containing protein [Panacibacter ginsenosidivorans]|uniref:WxcM-like domain-containing protein n=1 Tax=Panacibacter ginsenosidivorans TaxID=1813871 RepID=A0A5B8VF00_9BACT|nr:FdtA/QdtA family cupin domain-containing protein [Panacibacter ginsenosidivorans]QEC69086.1 WxcM-like domain-containing protein [Panacibacter ginsenosidivorans]